MTGASRGAVNLWTEPQLGGLREVGSDDVDCHWKWYEMVLLAEGEAGWLTGRQDR